MVAALNWWKVVFDRHTWGDKDTWALAAIALAHGGGGGGGGGGRRGDSGGGTGSGGHAGAAGSRVGWLARTELPSPSPVWGHVQFDATRDASNRSALLYMNWQQQYAAGFVDFQAEEPPGRSVSCCVMHRDHWAGPHDEKPVLPTITSAAHAPALQATFGDARAALAEVNAGVWGRERPHWLGQVRYRRCLIYWGVMLAGVTFAMASLWAWWEEERLRTRRGGRTVTVNADQSSR